MSDQEARAMWRNMRGLATRAAAERERSLVRALMQVRALGVDAGLYGNGIIVPESGFRYLAELATYPSAFTSPAQFGGIPVYTAPDWTFDPALIAVIRLRVILIDRWAGPLVRRITKWRWFRS